MKRKRRRRQRKPRRRLVTIKRVVVALIALATVSVVWQYRQAHRPPAWWSEARAAADHPQPAAHSAGVETAVSKVVTGAVEEAWYVTDEDANVWLAHRLPMWLSNREMSMPETVRRVLVRFEPGRVRIGIELEEPPGRTRYLSAAFEVELTGEHTLRATLLSVSSGRVTVPAGTVRPLLEPVAQQLTGNREPSGLRDLAELFDALVAGKALTLPSEIRLERFEPEAGRLWLKGAVRSANPTG